MASPCVIYHVTHADSYDVYTCMPLKGLMNLYLCRPTSATDVYKIYSLPRKFRLHDIIHVKLLVTARDKFFPPEQLYLTSLCHTKFYLHSHCELL